MASDAGHDIEIQRKYYTETAAQYDQLHVVQEDEHYLALAMLVAMLDHYQIRSVLDIGAGTGRTVAYLKQHRPDIRVIGMEPVAALREIGYQQGLAKDELIEGDALALALRPGEYDLVCAFGVLHHIRQPQHAVAEMLRVAGKAVFISDANNFGQGSALLRGFKQAINALGLWKLFDLIKTRGTGYTVSEEDGLAYSYSVFNNYRQIESACSHVHLFNTVGGRINFYRSASHVALMGIK